MPESPILHRALGPLYTSSIAPLEALEDLHSTHKIKTIISITKADIPDKYKTAPYNHIHIPIDDVSTEIIIPYFTEVNSAIIDTIYEKNTVETTNQLTLDGATRAGEKRNLSGDCVLIHCQSGTSRSVAFACAFLMWRHDLPLNHALHAIRRNYPEHPFQPNDGFVQQLNVYKESGYKTDLTILKATSSRYRAYRMEFLIPQMIGVRGENTKVGDDGSFSIVEGPKEGDEGWFGFKCDKCRCLLANSQVFIPHAPPYEEDDKQKYFEKTAYRSKRVINRQLGQNKCTHIFTEPLEWMEKTITDEEALEGRLDCYKCGNKVGGYNWKGGRCSCGKWMVPAIHLMKSRVVQIDRNNKLILSSDDRAV